jgi:hypothetical protein
VLVAAIGVPVAVTQLVALQRSVRRSGALVARLKEFRIEGLALRKELKPDDPNIRFFAEVKLWAAQVSAFLLVELQDEAEEETFSQEGSHLQPWEEVTAKLAWLRNDLLPKLREGYW